MSFLMSSVDIVGIKLLLGNITDKYKDVGNDQKR
jgi:hypothetical protein